ncbi:MAG: cupredoxin domain-containing protein [Chloroflexi bacterium]|nr:cupredoxin domain-containing protein [Chloroflexota bacterium]
MKKLEVISVAAVLAIIIAVPLLIVAYQYVYAPAQDPQAITLIMRTPENGNVTPLVIRVKKGQPVTLHVTSHDVTHGLMIAELGVDAGVIHAGKWTTVQFTPEEVGEFSYTCNIRCSPLHPKARGMIIVEE